MMKRIGYWVGMLFLLLQWSCDSKGIHITELDNADELLAVRFEELFSSPIMGISLWNNELWLFPSKNDVAIRLDPVDFTEVGSWGMRGKGSGEFLQCTFWNKDSQGKTMWLYDSGTKKLHSIEMSSAGDIADTAYQMQGVLPLASGAVLDDGMLIGNVLVGVGENANPLVLMDKEGNELRGIGLIPDENHRKVNYIRGSQSMMDYRSYTQLIAAYGHEFVTAMVHVGYLSFYESKEGEIRLISEVYLDEPKYTESNTLDVSVLRYGAMDMYMNEKFVYLVCSEKPLMESDGSRTLLVFDHKGHLKRHCHFDRAVQRIAVSSDNSILYAVTQDPEVGIALYHLD